jgi:hypothetical protein
MSQPDLIHSLVKRYKSIKQHDGTLGAMQQLWGERALIVAAHQQGRMTLQEANEMIDLYAQVAEELELPKKMNLLPG